MLPVILRSGAALLGVVRSNDSLPFKPDLGKTSPQHIVVAGLGCFVVEWFVVEAGVVVHVVQCIALLRPEDSRSGADMPHRRSEPRKLHAVLPTLARAERV